MFMCFRAVGACTLHDRRSSSSLIHSVSMCAVQNMCVLVAFVRSLACAVMSRCRVLQEHRSTKIAVISGVGTRHYYRKLGYHLEGPYMVKYLVQPADVATTPGTGAVAAGVAAQPAAAAEVQAAGSVGSSSRDSRVQRRRWTRPVAAAHVPGYNVGVAPAVPAVAVC